LGGSGAVYYKVDGGSAVIDAVGFTASHLHVQLSRFIVSDAFLKPIAKALEKIVPSVFKRVEFLPVALAEAIYLIDQDIRDRTSVLISCGMFSTAVAVVTGDSLIALDSFDMGTVHAVNDISIVMHIGFMDALKLAESPMSKTRDIVDARLEDMAQQIRDIIEQADKKLFEKPFFLVGGEVSSALHAHGIFEKVLGKEITKCADPYTEKTAGEVLSRDALISLALKKFYA
jgi:cell division ATPase FtsA